ncbi:MAG: hypothetical protein LBV47_04015 [Bacteroidales bacterium]|jgi:hypothetical protein|nr:hypothetical protein [Bacteroidales bacterium]
MKKTKIILSTIMLCILITGCEKQHKDSENILPIAADCMVVPFLDGIRIAKNTPEFYNIEESYVIKGVVLDKIEYGISVKLIEDIKGNFDKTSNDDIFTVWGYSQNQIMSSERSDHMVSYNTGDTLIMHVIHLPEYSSGIINEDRVWLEKPEDYCTISCTPSVVKLSDGYATGIISMEPEPVGKSYIKKLPIDEFENKLNELLNK